MHPCIRPNNAIKDTAYLVPTVFNSNHSIDWVYTHNSETEE